MYNKTYRSVISVDVTWAECTTDKHQCHCGSWGTWATHMLPEQSAYNGSQFGSAQNALDHSELGIESEMLLQLLTGTHMCHSCAANQVNSWTWTYEQYVQCVWAISTNIINPHNLHINFSSIRHNVMIFNMYHVSKI